MTERNAVGLIGDTLHIGEKCGCRPTCMVLETEDGDVGVDEFLDLDPDHDFEKGDVVRVVLGTKKGKAVWRDGQTPITFMAPSVGNVATIRKVMAGGFLSLRNNRCVSAACVELVEKADGRKPLREFEVGDWYKYRGDKYQVLGDGETQRTSGTKHDVPADSLRMPCEPPTDPEPAFEVGDWVHVAPNACDTNGAKAEAGDGAVGTILEPADFDGDYWVQIGPKPYYVSPQYLEPAEDIGTIVIRATVEGVDLEIEGSPESVKQMFMELGVEI